ncbi:uncharacterized protein LOC134672844 [Cydia fagiglandana]|uniref:uncharacterized protein LOC134672844 n=1 Tax=Cydia fagiglandana TaxID=1458189 RepID=UPI002FEE52F7
MTSLIFGANCAPFVAQFIKNKNAQRFESSFPAAVDAIVNSHYMDDYIDSLPDEATAIDMVRNVSDIHRAGGFEIRNWTSNSVAVLNSVPKETLGTAAVRFKVGQEHESERTLGLIWYPADDILGFDLSLKRIPSDVLEGENRPTKRLMLRVIMSIFDVLGFLAPFTIQGRIMLQEAWRLQVDWEDYIPDQIYLKWRKWVDLLKVVLHSRAQCGNGQPIGDSACGRDARLCGYQGRGTYLAPRDPRAYAQCYERLRRRSGIYMCYDRIE